MRSIIIQETKGNQTTFPEVRMETNIQSQQGFSSLINNGLAHNL